ncbi:MAG: hypothetical protein J2P26_01835 [Nocardiopsaceae bacterium]|nr:hypothetical protein [Nocardiopsaceae bacterium]
MATEKVTISVPDDRVVVAARRLAEKEHVPFSNWLYRTMRAAVLQDELSQLGGSVFEQDPEFDALREEAQEEIDTTIDGDTQRAIQRGAA